MDSPIFPKHNEPDLKSIIEFGLESIRNSVENDADEFDSRFGQAESPEQLNPKFPIKNYKEQYLDPECPFEVAQAPSFAFGSRTYTSPASIESSSINKQSKSRCTIVSKQADLQETKEKFSMLREIIENVHDPNKRKILLDFLDQSTIKTEYVTVKESSSCSEQQQRLNNVLRKNKRRPKSPGSVAPNTKLYRYEEKFNAVSQERRRYSQSRQKGELQYSSRKNNGNQLNIKNVCNSDEFDSRNEDN